MAVMIQVEDGKVVWFCDLDNVCLGSMHTEKQEVRIGLKHGALRGQSFRLCPATNKHEFLAKIALAIAKNESIVWLYPSEAKETEHSIDEIMPLSCVRMADYY